MNFYMIVTKQVVGHITASWKLVIYIGFVSCIYKLKLIYVPFKDHINLQFCLRLLKVFQLLTCHFILLFSFSTLGICGRRSRTYQECAWTWSESRDRTENVGPLLIGEYAFHSAPLDLFSPFTTLSLKLHRFVCKLYFPRHAIIS